LTVPNNIKIKNNNHHCYKNVF